MREDLRGFFRALREATPSDCRKVYTALEDMRKKNASPLALELQKILLLYGVTKEDPEREDLKKGDFGRVNVNIKVEKNNGQLVYILTGGKEKRDEIAAFPGFLQAALVTRYLSGGNMRQEDARNALAAISEFDLAQEKQGAE